MTSGYTLPRPPELTDAMLLDSIIALLPAITAVQTALNSNSGGGATDTVLATRASESTLAAILAGLANKATDAGLAAIISALSGKATDATVAAITAALANKATDATAAGTTTALANKSTEATLLALKTSVDSLIAALPVKAATVTLVTPSVNVLTASVVIAPANPNRRGFVIWNNSANSVYVSLAATSSSSTPTQIVATFTSWIMLGPLAYQGAISAIRNSGSGTCAVWEFT